MSSILYAFIDETADAYSLRYTQKCQQRPEAHFARDPKFAGQSFVTEEPKSLDDEAPEFLSTLLVETASADIFDDNETEVDPTPDSSSSSDFSGDAGEFGGGGSDGTW